MVQIGKSTSQVRDGASDSLGELLDTQGSTELYLKRERASLPGLHLPRALLHSAGAPGDSNRPAFNFVLDIEGCEFSLANAFTVDGLCPRRKGPAGRCGTDLCLRSGRVLPTSAL